MGILGKPYFRGQSLNRLDPKGRLRIPTKFREVLQKHYTDGLIVTLLGECLVAYPPETWEAIEDKAQELSQVQPEQRDFLRYFISNAEECEFDNQGRILIPPLLRERAGLDKEVLIAGVLKSFEIWDKAAWDKHIDLDSEQYRQIMNSAAGVGL